MIKKVVSLCIPALFGCFIGTQSMAATVAAESMHYGNTSATSLKKSGDASIVVTNCSDQMANVGAWFTDGSSKAMPIYPVGSYPMNMISIDNSYHFVNISVTAMDGTTLFPYQPVYPGQHVNIGCGAKKLGAHPAVTVSAH